jgi:hypothetical protein
MTQITITEALAETKLIKNKIAKKKEYIGQNLGRLDNSPDLLESLGGSEKAMAAELQAISDLRTRLVTIRTAIQKANLENCITVKNKTMTIAEWISWKREVLIEQLPYVQEMQNGIRNFRHQNETNPRCIKDEKTGEVKVLKLLMHVNAVEIMKEAELLGEIRDTLDGQLSLKNATITVTI